MNTASYAHRRAVAISTLVEWAKHKNPTPEIAARLAGQVGNVPENIRELQRLEALAELLTSEPKEAGAIKTSGKLPDISDADKDEIPELVKSLGPKEILSLIGQELSEAKPDRPVVTALEKEFIARVRKAEA